MSYQFDKDWTLDKYFKQTGEYQGRCYWHDIRDWLKKRIKKM